ncbi:MAG TPA: aminotransferase class V-fold PLP-dependent enzyme, partial [Stellaceae bacterium]|nr:aminotransferase class V-fold PLP-dependent enzyme [Stellaceae bacterium]
GLQSHALITSTIEHDSVRGARRAACEVGVSHDGVIDLDALDRALAAAPRPALVSLMLANNETGVIEPVAEAARLAHARGALFHCDAVQAAGKMPIAFRRLGADLLSLSAHKLGGPMGVGALVVGEGVPLAAGGGQERGRRAGTENLIGIMGFGAAAALGVGSSEEIARLRDEAERRLTGLAPGARIYGAGVPRLPNTIAISMPGVPASTQVMALDLAGVMVSAGAACSSGKVARSHVLAAMGVPEEEALCAIRVSFGSTSRAEEVDHLVAAWGALYERRGARAA